MTTKKKKNIYIFLILYEIALIEKIQLQNFIYIIYIHNFDLEYLIFSTFYTR